MTHVQARDLHNPPPSDTRTGSAPLEPLRFGPSAQRVLPFVSVLMKAVAAGIAPLARLAGHPTDLERIWRAEQRRALLERHRDERNQVYRKLSVSPF